jgi:hypothetical protein
MQVNSLGWHTLFSADIYLSFQQRKATRKAPGNSSKPRFQGIYSRARRGY